MAAARSSLRHKHVRIDQVKLRKARKALGAETDTETIDRALALAAAEAEIDGALRAARGKVRIKKIFR